MIQIENGKPVYIGDTFKIILKRYSDPDRMSLAESAAIYLGKPDRDNTRRPLSIIKQGHVPEIFRGEHAKFEFVDVSKEVYDHLVTYTTRDMRAAGGNRALTSDDFALPSDKVKNEEAVRMNIACSFTAYQELLELGETTQVARSAMPVAAKMNPFVYQFNFLTLMQSVFNQRIWQKGAQGNTVKVVKGMFALVHAQDAELWDTALEYFGVPAVEWRNAGQKLKRMNVGDFVHEIQMRSIPDDNVWEVIRGLYGEEKSMWG